MTEFKQLLRAEWTKFHTVRGWVAGIIAAAGLIVGLGLLPGVQGTCIGESACVLPVGPEGEEVVDSFSFVHQPLTGDGTITVRVANVTAELPVAPEEEELQPGNVPWAKAGLLLKDGTKQGSAYAAVMMTGQHGTRMQHNYIHDRAGKPGSPADPRWLRLTRSGDIITGEESPDGTHWTTIHRVQLKDLPSTVEAGIFTTSPQFAASAGTAGAWGSPTKATGTFDNLTLSNGWTPREWISESIGGPASPPAQQDGGTFIVTGSGDIAPAVSGAAGIGVTIAQTLVGTFAGLIIVVVIGVMFATSEYRRGLIRLTLAATPRRSHVLAAKAIIIGAVTFVTGLIAATIVVTIGQKLLRSNGAYVHPSTTLTEVRVIAGTAALLAIAAILGLALGTLLRRSTTAVTLAIVTIVLPYLLTMTVLPTAAGQWLLRITPASAFAIQQSNQQYAQVANLYIPVNGYFPLPPWAGLTVLAAWATLSLGLATYLLRRRDA
jgi:hypothetical protein